MKPTGDIILITGANGRIGTALMKRLSERFDNVVGLQQDIRFLILLDCCIVNMKCFLVRRARFLTIDPYIGHLRFLPRSSHHRQSPAKSELLSHENTLR